MPTVPTPTAIPSPLIAVVGGAAGASMVSVAVAQALALGRPAPRPVVLADFALDARQGARHGAPDLATGLSDLLRQPPDRRSSGAALAATIPVPRRGYRLLLGLRDHGDWVSVRPAALDAVLDDLRRSAGWVVAEVDPDLEGEASTGSFDIEDRNLLARTAARRAHLVLAACATDLAGAKDAAVLLRNLAALDVAPGRTLLVAVQGPCRATWSAPEPRVAEILLPHRRATARSAASGRRLPRSVVRPLAGAVDQALSRAAALPAPPTSDPPVRIVPGELGHWPT
jgi:hypothetical protein